MQEIFASAGGAVFDPLVAADIAAQAVLEALLAPTRLTRLNQQAMADSGLPSAAAVIDRLIAGPVEAADGAVARRAAYRAILTLARTSRDPKTSPDVAALIEDRLDRLAGRLGKVRGEGDAAAWSRSMARLLSDSERLDRDIARLPRAPAIPEGMPIGGASTDASLWAASLWADADWMGDLR